MSTVEIHVTVESNVDHLNARAVHRIYEDLVSRMLQRGAELLRVNVPKDTGQMAAHVGNHGPIDAPGLMRGSVGISPVDSENRRFQTGTKDLFSPGEQNSSNYPLFVDRGTGVFGPAHAPIHSRRASVMRFDTAEGPLFRREVQGQRGQHFMLETYEQMRRTLLPIESTIFEERVKHLAADPDPRTDFNV